MSREPSSSANRFAALQAKSGGTESFLQPPPPAPKARPKRVRVIVEGPTAEERTRALSKWVSTTEQLSDTDRRSLRGRRKVRRGVARRARETDEIEVIDLDLDDLL